MAFPLGWPPSLNSCHGVHDLAFALLLPVPRVRAVALSTAAQGNPSSSCDGAEHSVPGATARSSLCFSQRASQSLRLAIIHTAIQAVHPVRARNSFEAVPRGVRGRVIDGSTSWQGCASFLPAGVPASSLGRCPFNVLERILARWDDYAVVLHLA